MPRSVRHLVVLDCSYFAWRNARRNVFHREDARQEEQPSVVLPFTFTDSPMDVGGDVNVVLRPTGWVKS